MIIGEIEKIGIIVCFWLSFDIFKYEIMFKYSIFFKCLWEFLFLNLGVFICLVDECDGKEEYFYYEGGIKVYVEFLNEGKMMIYNILFYFFIEKDDIGVEILL